MIGPAVGANSEYVCLAGVEDSAGAAETAGVAGSVMSLCGATAPVAVADSVAVGLGLVWQVGTAEAEAYFEKSGMVMFWQVVGLS